MSETTPVQSIKNMGPAPTSPQAPSHGQVKTGDLPLVQVRKAMTTRSQVQPAHQPVEILPPRNAQSAVRTGGLPQIQVKMGANGPQPDNGQEQPVVILPPKGGPHGHGITTGGLPQLQVKTAAAGPPVQNRPTTSAAPPQIPSAAPIVSQPRGGYNAGGGYNASPRPTHVARVAAPQPVVALPPVPELTTEQIMLCRHSVDKYLAALRTAEVDAETTEATTLATEEVAKLAETTIVALDQMMVSVAIRIEAEEKAAAAAAAAALVKPTTTVSTWVPTAVAAPVPVPTASYVAGRVGGHRNALANTRGQQRNAGMAPRGVARGDSKLPPVIVKMNGRNAEVQNRAEVEAARAAVLAARNAEPFAEVVQAEVVATDLPQG